MMLLRRLHSPRHALTLLELVVVLAILVALGGLLVPLLGNYLHRANIASCAVNIPEMDKWVQTYYQLYGEYPNKLDNLVGGMGGADGYVAVGDYEGATPTASIEVKALSEGEAKALTEAGITTLCTILKKSDLTDPTKPGDWNPTFWPYGDNRGTDPTPEDVDEGVSVATLTATGCRLMGLPYSAQHKYVIFGANSPCTMFRTVAAEAPTHYADTPAEDPSKYYMCFGLVFQVAKSDGATTPASEALELAKYVGTVAFHDFGLSTAGMHTMEWWERLRKERTN